MRRCIWFLGTLVLVGCWGSAEPARSLPSNLQQVTGAIRAASAYKCRLTRRVSERPESHEIFGTLQWEAPNSMRQETRMEGKLLVIEIFPPNEPGVEVHARRKTFRELPIDSVRTPHFRLLDWLGKYEGSANRDLGSDTIDHRQVRGFEIADVKIDPEAAAAGTLRVWAEAGTNLPLRVEYETRVGDALVVLGCDEFFWNPPTYGWFGKTIPGKYVAAPDKQTLVFDKVAAALALYARYNEHKYPEPALVYSDAARSKLYELAKVPRRAPPEPEKKKVFDEVDASSIGFYLLDMLLRENVDGVYYGQSVAPTDKDRVLCRWRLENGRYQVLFGDLHDQTMSRDELGSLERAEQPL